MERLGASGTAAASFPCVAGSARINLEDEVFGEEEKKSAIDEERKRFGK